MTTTTVPTAAVRRLHGRLAELDERDRQLSAEYSLLRGHQVTMRWSERGIMAATLESSARAVNNVATEAAHLRSFLRELGLEKPLDDSADIGDG